MKLKIEIKTIGGSVLFSYEKENNTIKDTLEQAVKEGAYLRDANLGGANLGGANLRDANLGGANLRDAKELPQEYINSCSRDMLFVFEHLKAELPYLREKLVGGHIDGTQYEGSCACLIGSLGKGNKQCIDKVVKAIPYYEKGLDNPCEQWFYQIRKGDTPENNTFAKHALELIDSVLQSLREVEHE